MGSDPVWALQGAALGRRNDPGGFTMEGGRKSVTAALAAFCAMVLYPLFLILSTLFVIPVSMVQKALSSRTDVVLGRRAGLIHRTRWFVFADVVATVLTYLSADFARCEFRGVAWPEAVAGYGATRWIHLAMLAALALAWPSILYWLGWYRARARSWKWRVKNTGAAAVLLALFMSAVALLAFREIYPRMQIGLTVILLPVVTGVVRFAMEWMERIVRRNYERRTTIDLVW